MRGCAARGGHVGKVTRDTGKDKVAVQRCNCGGAACKSAKVETIDTGGGWQEWAFTQGETGDRMVGWGGARFSEPAVGHY